MFKISISANKFYLLSDKKIKIINIALVLISIFIGFLHIFFGIDWADTAFHALSFQGNLKMYWMTFGSSLIGGLWVKIFGDQIVVLRILNVICNFSAVLIGYYCIPKEKRNKVFGVVFLISTFFWISTHNNILGYNSFTIPAIALCFLFTNRFCDKQSFWNCVLLFLSIIFAISVRFPNITIIVPITFMCMQVGRSFVKLATIISLSIVTWYLLVITVVGMDAFSTGLQLDDSHTMLALAKGAIYPFFQLSSVGSFVGLVIKYRGIAKVMIANFFLFILLLMTYLMEVNHLLVLFIFPCLIVFGKFDLSKNSKFNGLYILLFALVAPLGSNTGMFQLQNGFIFFIPFLVNVLLSNVNKVSIFFVAIITFSFFYTIFRKCTFQDGRILSIVSNPYNKMAYNDKCQFLFSDKNWDFVNNAGSLDYLDKTAVFWGCQSNMYYYLLNRKKADPFFINNSSVSNAKWLFKYLENDSNNEVVLTDTVNRRYLEKSLAKMHFYKAIETSGGTVFKRDPNCLILNINN